jgi:hypothetical protein
MKRSDVDGDLPTTGGLNNAVPPCPRNGVRDLGSRRSGRLCKEAACFSRAWRCARTKIQYSHGTSHSCIPCSSCHTNHILWTQLGSLALLGRVYPTSDTAEQGPEGRPRILRRGSVASVERGQIMHDSHPLESVRYADHGGSNGSRSFSSNGLILFPRSGG